MTTARACLVVSLCGLALASSARAAPRVCFTASDNRDLSFEVYQEAPPPVDEVGRNYAFWPATAVATQNLDRLTTTRAHLVKYYWQWANRSTEGVRNAAGALIERKGNFQPGLQRPLDQRTRFTSIDKANACTLAQTAAVLGQDAAAARYAASSGVRIARPEAQGARGMANAVDVCVLLDRPLPADAAGVLLDYEVQDGRTPEQSLSFLTEFARLVHSGHRQAFLLTNPLDAPSQKYTGITEDNAGKLAALYDHMTVFLWHGNAEHDVKASFGRQMDILAKSGPVDPRRLVIAFELANTSTQDARAARDAITSRHMAGVIFWRDYAAQGGACDDPVNIKIACIAFGRCA
jgi:hypothetical protein